MHINITFMSFCVLKMCEVGPPFLKSREVKVTYAPNISLTEQQGDVLYEAVTREM
jgi:hypothetical protein